jgi:uncharacterized protein YcfJ
MARLPFLLLALALPASAADVLIDFYNSDKARIAEAFKAAMQTCASTTANRKDGCKQAAEHQRQVALKAASAERNAGLTCRERCGRVTEIKQAARDGDNTVVGTAGGGVGGAVIGRTLAGNSSSATKNIATLAGAVGGALLGKKIEQNMHRKTVWTVAYTLYDGKQANADFDQAPNLKVGDPISISDGKPVRR